MEKRFIKCSDTLLTDMAFAYCMGKSWLFRCFFGWRLTNLKGCEFILSKRAWRELEEYIEDMAEIRKNYH